jgi:hypothetical protein
VNRSIPVLLLCLLALPAAAQEERPLTDQAAAAITAFYNRTETLRLRGEAHIPRGTAVEADVAALGGPLRVGGVIRGAVVVINGDLELAPGGRITGPVSVVGGRVRGPAGWESAVVYSEPLRFRWQDGRLVALGPAVESWLNAGWRTGFGRAELILKAEDAYNRVEGLPITLGPRLRLGRTNPTIIDLRVVYRTGSGLRIHPDELGHDLRIAQYLGGRRTVRVGIGHHRSIDAIEDNGVSDTENSLSTFILHRDYRDHYERRGWSAFVLYGGRTRPLDLGLEYRTERHNFVASAEPWSLLDNDEPWRRQPRVAEGDLQTLRGWLVWDTRNERVDPATGWLVRVETEQGLEGDLRLPVGPRPDRTFRSVDEEFTTVLLDVRRYLRLGPRTRLSLRAAAAGSPDDGALPPQRQHALGGEGSLPGFGPFAFDCGARQQPLDGEFAYYGCDRSVLFQVEGRLALWGTSRYSVGRRLGLDFDLSTTPEIVLFADGGRAWIEAESRRGRLDLGPSSFQFDAGAGLRLGPVGAYLALPITGDNRSLNFFIRLGPRL